MLNIIITEDAVGKRLDVWLAQNLKGQYSRSQLQNFIKNGCVFLDNVLVNNTKHKIKTETAILIKIPEAINSNLEVQDIDLNILYEDEDILVLNKPKGLIVHPGAGNINGTLVNALLHHCKDSLSGIGGVKRPGIVHRLDKNTSGIMVIAKNDIAHVNLSEQFADHGKTGSLKRKYKAIIWGSLEPKNGTIKTYLARSNKDRTKRTVVNSTAIGAKYAVTHYKTLNEYKTHQISLIECELETGRTHQIRVHMAYMGAPLISDKEYGNAFKTKSNKLNIELQQCIEQLSRQALHAYFLQFIHPTKGELMRFEKELPEDMSSLLELLEA